MISRGADELERTAAGLRASGARARALPCDVTDAAAVAALFAALPRCDVLV